MSEPTAERPIRAKTTRSDTAYDVYVASTPGNGAMSVWQLRDFLRAIDAAGIPDDAKLSDHHNHATTGFVGLSVRHTFVVEPAPEQATDGPR